jgi:hypothetical protein
MDATECMLFDRIAEFDNSTRKTYQSAMQLLPITAIKIFID